MPILLYKTQIEGDKMRNRIIGKFIVKQCLYKVTSEKPQICDSAVEYLNTYFEDLLEKILERANEYRKLVNPNARLNALHIKFALKDLER